MIPWKSTRCQDFRTVWWSVETRIRNSLAKDRERWEWQKEWVLWIRDLPDSLSISLVVMSGAACLKICFPRASDCSLPVRSTCLRFERQKKLKKSLWFMGGCAQKSCKASLELRSHVPMETVAVNGGGFPGRWQELEACVVPVLGPEAAGMWCRACAWWLCGPGSFSREGTLFWRAAVREWVTCLAEQ